MNCTRARDLLTKGGAGDDARLARHLEGCSGCRRFADQMVAVRRGLRDHHTVIEPDGAFSARVLQRLEEHRHDQTTELLGWAALRLLPVAVVLALLLGGWSFLGSPGPEALLASVDQDPIAWALGEEVGNP